MDYNLNALNPYDFEQLIQALSKRIIGNGAISFGDGPDGGREAIFEGKAPYPSHSQQWSGYWVIQAKFKIVNAEKESTDFSWLKSVLKKEMDKYKKKETKKPNNFLFFTNIRLTAVSKSGTQDHAAELSRANERKTGIKNIRIISYDDIRDFLDIYRDVAIAYSSFILSGDILQKLLQLLDDKVGDAKIVNDVLARFLEVEFRDHLPSKLEHAGKLTNNKINLERVFIDLKVNELTSGYNEKSFGFVNSVITAGNTCNRVKNATNKFVLVAGPGYGKSTLTQFVCQIYRVHFLKNIDSTATNIPELDDFLSFTKDIITDEFVSLRFPIQITLKDYAGWISDRKLANEDVSIIKYVQYRISLKTFGNEIKIERIIDLLKTLSFVFVFDGLDEVPPSANRAEVLNEIKTFIETDLRRFETDYVIIATTRPKGYSNDFDERKFHHLSILDLEYDDCIHYASRLLLNSVSEVDTREMYLSTIKRAYKDQVVGLLMKSPLQVSIMAILVQSGGEPPRNKYDLFNEYYSIVVRREKQKNVVKILNEHSSYIEDIHNYLGYYLQVKSEHEGDASATITDEEFKNVVSIYIKQVIGLEGNELAEVYISEIIDASKERIVFISEIEDKRIGFNIRSLQEYFAANYYLQNKKDDIIPEKLRQIALSSYWSNTFLFCLGYLAKHKRYMIYSVESTCNEFNGSLDYWLSKSLTGTCKFGSWLALDILNEGVFRSWPNYEGKFLRFLSDLLTIPPNSKHSEVVKLPPNIKTRLWEFIEINLRQPFERQTTSWIVAGFLIQADGLSQLSRIYKFWPQDPGNAKELIKTLMNYELITNIWFIDKFLNALKQNSTFTFYDQLSFTRSSKMILELYSSHLIESDTKRILLENFIFKLLSSHRIVNLSKELTAISEGTISGEIIALSRGQIRLPLVENLQIVFTKIGMEKNDSSAKIILLLRANELKLLVNIVSFLLEPSRLKLLDVIKDLSNGELPKRQFAIIRNLNWLFKRILSKKNFSIDESEDTANWDRFELELEALRSFPIERMGDLCCGNWGLDQFAITKENIREYHESFYLKIGEFPQFKNQIAECYLKLLSRAADHLFGREEELDLITRSALIHCMNTVIKTGVVGQIEKSIVYFVSLLSIEEIETFAKENSSFFINFDYERNVVFSTSDLALNNAFGKISKIVAHQCSINEESNLIPLLLGICIGKSIFAISDGFEIIPYKALAETKFESKKLRIYRDLLLIFDPGFSVGHYNLIKETIKEITTNNLKSVFYILSTEILVNNLFLEKLIIEMKEVYSEPAALVHNIKKLLERTPSGLSPDIDLAT